MEQIEREREDQEKKLKKMEQEMEQVFEMKVKEKKKKLRDSENEVSGFTLFYLIHNNELGRSKNSNQCSIMYVMF